jgi:hypothetical protein
MVRLVLVLDEADLVGAAVSRDRDRVLDAALGHGGTRLLTDQELALVPTHQEVLKKLEEAIVVRGRELRAGQGADAVGQDLHQARLAPWPAAELMAHLCSIVDTLAAASKDRSVSPLDVALELFGGELEAFVLFGRMGHLDPPREDSKVPIAILFRHKSEDPEIDRRIRDAAKKWAAEQESRS